MLDPHMLVNPLDAHHSNAKGDSFNLNPADEKEDKVVNHGWTGSMQ